MNIYFNEKSKAFMYIFGGFYAATLFILPFKKEVEIDDEEEDGENSLPLNNDETASIHSISSSKSLAKKLLKAYKLIWNLVKIKPIRLIALVLLTCKVILEKNNAFLAKNHVKFIKTNKDWFGHRRRF